MLRDTEEKTCLLIDIFISDDSNVNTKETGKLRKYKDLEIEVRRVWNLRTKIVSVVFGALGTIKKGLDQNLLLLPRSPVGHRATEDHTNEHYTYHSQVLGVNRFDLLLRSGLTRTPPLNNEKAGINLQFNNNNNNNNADPSVRAV